MTDVIVRIFVGAAALGGLVLCFIAVVLGKEARFESRGRDRSATPRE